MVVEKFVVVAVVVDLGCCWDALLFQFGFIIVIVGEGAFDASTRGAFADVATTLRGGLRELGFKMLMQIHDEVILEGPEAHKDEALALVKRHMEKPFNDHENLCDVDLNVDGNYAKTWFDAK